MKIQYASDLHLEFPENTRFLMENPIIPKADIMVLAGDIVPFAHLEMADWFFDYLSKHFKLTYWVAGNHEYYRSDINLCTGTVDKPIRENIRLVNNITVKHEDVNLIFSTLWTKIRDENKFHIQRGMNDYHLIRDSENALTPEKTNVLNQENIAFLTAELECLRDEKTVVTTHHVPTLMNYPEQFKGDLLSEGFAVELFEMIDDLKPNVWIYGHSHHSQTKFLIGETAMLCNALGYVHIEKTTYQNSRTIRL